MEAKRESHNLRDFLRIKEAEDRHHQNATTRHGHDNPGSSGSGLTLLAILSDKPASCRGQLTAAAATVQVQSDAVVSERIQQQRHPISRAQSNRTLLDILREEQTSSTHIGGPRHRDHSKLRWGLLKNIICLNHHWRSNNANHDSNEDNLIIVDAAAAGHVETRGEAPARMSLMALLEENDRQMGLDGFGHVMYAADEEEINGERGTPYFNNCCVCMVRHKGAAFIPCGHTFCRLCSRELWVQRGNCPLCNNYIQEILDIF